MDEQRLAQLALVCAALGLAGLLAASQLLLVEPLALERITIADAGRTVQACGSVASVREKNSNVFLTLEEDGARLPLVVFASSAANLPELKGIQRGDRVCATAAVNEYPAGSGSLELVYRRGAFTVESGGG